MGKPKGMFYLTLNSPVIPFSEGMTKETVEQKVFESFAFDGYMVGDENTPFEMDRYMTKKSSITKAELTAKGLSARTKIITPERYEEISEKMFEKIRGYAEAITEGDTKIFPFAEGEKTACDYCDFASVCGFEKGSGCFRTLKKGD